jgi:hypothetical protein
LTKPKAKVEAFDLHHLHWLYTSPYSSFLHPKPSLKVRRKRPPSHCQGRDSRMTSELYKQF